ncbi:glycoside hydrolase family 43 protein [Parapedobacter indicus]|uniref:Glycosyl hydrolases family 43 n=1 Tax=Parapedobacter indicus TaxID=1477437 RepID=A0A1I3GV25_9SPHI|nr:glycoside hydrolase family 43 protein [Parapedobacter indicus]PPL02790.1 glycosyl hydrolase family 43 [Parapedobacter indicus]SFI27199.1 Glycosyl hydrolases family 43 [Parapedobacter indicus]
MQKKRQFIVWVVFMVSCLLVGQYASAQENISKVHITDLHVRDPYIVADQQSELYILYKSAPVKDKQGTDASGVVAYHSKDLEYWEGPYVVYNTPPDNWIKGAIWAPEVHSYQGKYYLFATLNSDIEWKLRREGFPKYTFRGTQLFYADNPMGPFLPFEEKLPHTPMDYMALDGTLWVEDGIPYLVYCHEWVQIEDGTMELVQLEQDLSKTVGSSLTLFHASSASWSTGNQHPDGTRTYVTDGCFLYRTKTGKLLMIWSSFKEGSYAIGIAESTTGKVTGPWKQQENLLFYQHGGHGMLFKTFDGRLMLTFHQPNSPSGKERAQIYEVIDTGNTLTLKD